MGVWKGGEAFDVYFFLVYVLIALCFLLGSPFLFCFHQKSSNCVCTSYTVAPCDKRLFLAVFFIGWDRTGRRAAVERAVEQNQTAERTSMRDLFAKVPFVEPRVRFGQMPTIGSHCVCMVSGYMKRKWVILLPSPLLYLSSWSLFLLCLSPL
jgi:hypothetical protein